MRRLMTIPVMMFLSTLAIGQELGVDEVPEIRRYTVEVIIFRYAEEVSVGTELFLPDAPIVEEISPEPEFVFGDTMPEPEPEPEIGEFETLEEVRGEEFILHIEDDYSTTTIGQLRTRVQAFLEMIE